MDGSQISCAALRALALNSREQLIQEQREDPELGHIYRYLENPDDGSVNATVCEGWSHDFKLIDGLLFYAKYSTTLGELRGVSLKVPWVYRKDNPGSTYYFFSPGVDIGRRKDHVVRIYKIAGSRLRKVIRYFVPEQT
ncbi:hypothetical protein TNCV_4742461 [Trichonephila clavipes]|nr:hypothetical protein TNCV_4742461 [Trichonephila clavipes]